LIFDLPSRLQGGFIQVVRALKFGENPALLAI
jgi:hypothetical protein